ncbi:MAG: hypothetical protein Q8Q54_06840 [Methylococcales bacterium]|nr:hypothetical protein [Methylococcales bacterium]
MVVYSSHAPAWEFIQQRSSVVSPKGKKTLERQRLHSNAGALERL